jgi:CBS domain containing-hemolysin-like protein
MVPRTEIIALDVDEGIDRLREMFIESHLSKILIFKGSIDNIIGYTHAFELFKKPDRILTILRPVSFIPESMTADEILNLLIRERRSLAVVLDEFGGTSGLVTVEDVVEELFGEIDDEHDVEELVERRLGENEYLFSARQEIDSINDKYNLDLPDSEFYSTLGGLILHHLESIPVKGEEVSLDNLHFRVEEVSHSKIELVRLKVVED